jgi:hypothetical protein
VLPAGHVFRLGSVRIVWKAMPFTCGKAQPPNRNLRAASDNWPRSHVIAKQIAFRRDLAGGTEERYSLLVAKQRRFAEIL